MSETAFDTLGAARRLKAAGLEAEQADAIVEIMGQSANQLVTVERFDAGLAMLQARIDSVETGLNARIDKLEARVDKLDARIDKLEARIDKLDVRIDMLDVRIGAVRAELRADIARSILIAVGVLIAANALMMTILGMLLTGALGV